MRNKQQSERFRMLRDREQRNTLTEAERRELTLLVKERDEAEIASLSPAIERMQNERLRINAQNRALKALARRRERLVKRLERFLADTQAERQAIETELTHVLNDAPVSAGTGR